LWDFDRPIALLSSELYTLVSINYNVVKQWRMMNKNRRKKKVKSQKLTNLSSVFAGIENLFGRKLVGIKPLDLCSADFFELYGCILFGTVCKIPVVNDRGQQM
jgi:hypothetical protein